MSIDTEKESPSAQLARSTGRWIEEWNPEDKRFWASVGARVANRNLWLSILTEHVGFSIWSLWSVMVLFMGPAYGFDAADKFYLVSTPTLVGAVMRLPYTLAVAKFGGRNWTVISALLLLIPTLAAAVVIRPGVSFTTLLVVAAIAGFGGGNFASSMTNINAFFPEHRKGWALGLNAGGGNLGVAAIQLLALGVIATTGTATPHIVLFMYLPLIVVSAVFAALFMDNLATVRNDTRALRESAADPQTWIMSFLYIGTFGSFIGYSFAFGLVLQNQFGRTPLQAAAVTFLGPLVGSLIRPVGGWLADRVGGARVTLWNFLAMAVSAAVIMAASQVRSLPVFTTGFILLFFFSGLGNGSTYKMIPAIFHAKALARAQTHGESETESLLWARRMSGAVIGICGAVGALGGLFINLVFRQSFLSTRSGTLAFAAFLGFYVICMAITYLAYVHASPRRQRRSVNHLGRFTTWFTNVENTDESYNCSSLCIYQTLFFALCVWLATTRAQIRGSASIGERAAAPHPCSLRPTEPEESQQHPTRGGACRSISADQRRRKSCL